MVGRALADLEEVLGRSPGNAEALRLRGIARLERARQEADKGGDFEAVAKTALADLDEAIKRDPGPAEGWAGRGEIRAAVVAHRMARGDFSGRGELEAAVADYDQALKRDPKRAATYAGRAFARQKGAVARFFARVPVADLFKAALQDLDEAVLLKPSDAGLRHQKAGALFEVGVHGAYRGESPRDWYAAALNEFEETGRLDPAMAPILAARVQQCRRLAAGNPATEEPERHIEWAKTWEAGQREARIRRVPIFFYVSGGAG